MSNLINGNIWKLIANEYQERDFAIIETNKLPINIESKKEIEIGNYFDILHDKKIAHTTTFGSAERGSNRTNRSFVVPICVHGELREIRIIFPCVNEDISKEDLIKNYYSYPDQSFFREGFEKFILMSEDEIDIKTGELTIFQYLAYSQTLEYSGNKQSYAQELKDSLIVDSEQIGKILNGEDQNTDIIPFGFSLSWNPGKYLVREIDIKNPKTDKTINYGLSIQPQGFYERWDSGDDIMDIESMIINEHENHK
jgi:hypothetical protein